MRRLQRWQFRNCYLNEFLEELNSSPRRPSKQRIKDLLALLQKVDGAEKLLWEDLSRRMRAERFTSTSDKFREIWKSPVERSYDSLLSKIDHLLQRYQSVPVLSRAFFEVDELTGLRFEWVQKPARPWESWENQAVRLILEVIERKEFHRIRTCRNCSKWFCGQTDHQVHCSDNCRKLFATKDSRFREKRRLYMAKRRKADKVREAREDAARGKG